MAKKLLTKDQNMISEVENVLKTKKVKYVKYNVSDGTIIAVLNRDGEAIHEAVNEVKSTSSYYLGVLHGKPQYHVPNDLLIELSKVK